MGTCQSGSILSTRPDGIAISEAAIRTCGPLVVAAAGRIRTHAYRDGGLICEDRTSPARPRLWRITPDGRILPDSSYSFARGRFMAAPAPGQAVAA